MLCIIPIRLTVICIYVGTVKVLDSFFLNFNSNFKTHINNFAELLHIANYNLHDCTSAEIHDLVYNPVQYGYDFHLINLLSINLLQGAICTHVGLYDPIKRKHDVRKL